MPRLTITSSTGEERVLDAPLSRTLMEIIRENDFDELLAICGGSCSCATCHVYVDPAYLSRLPPMSEDEDTLLDEAEHRRETSRLSCQIRMTESLDGLQVTIAPSE